MSANRPKSSSSAGVVNGVKKPGTWPVRADMALLMFVGCLDQHGKGLSGDHLLDGGADALHGAKQCSNAGKRNRSTAT